MMLKLIKQMDIINQGIVPHYFLTGMKIHKTSCQKTFNRNHLESM